MGREIFEEMSISFVANGLLVSSSYVTRCLKKYCYCFRNNISCTDKCFCKDCENQDIHKLKGSQEDATSFDKLSDKESEDGHSEKKETNPNNKREEDPNDKKEDPNDKKSESQSKSDANQSASNEENEGKSES